MRRVVVTGAKGGTGRSLVDVLRRSGYDVLGVDVLPVGPTEEGYVRHDILEAGGLHDILAGAAGVVHFGSYPTDSWTSGSEAFRNVLMGGFNVFQACANLGIKRIVYASSIEGYGDLFAQPSLPVTEESPQVPRSLYGSAKVLLERSAADFCRWHGMSIAALRLGRIVYERCFDWRLRRHTDSDASAADVLWSYVDARDVATACQAWLESDAQGFSAFNVAADDVCVHTPTRTLLAEHYAQVAVAEGTCQGRRCPYDNSKLKAALGWQPQYNWQALRAEADREVVVVESSSTQR